MAAGILLPAGHSQHNGGMKRALALSSSVVVAAAALAITPAQAVPSPFFEAKATSWSQAAAQLGTAGSLWEPTRRLGLQRRGTVNVYAENLTIVNGSVVRGGDALPGTAAAAQYGTNRRGFDIVQKWANTTWSLGIADSWQQAPVSTARVNLMPHDPDRPNTVTVRIFANCWRPNSTRPAEPPRSFRCSQADVQRFGGVMTLTARPVSTMTAPGNTTIRVSSNGLTYNQLLRIASGLQQVTGTVEQGTGSAMMQATCRQMVDGKMTTEQADALAQGNGYITRVVKQDGVDLPTTMDFRYNRINLAVTGGVVTDCPSFG